ncbi:MAG: phosphoenolpyruvate--protein phosphotransferase [Planctomycetota bacterium]|nr:phosphoenolpyruvate--protein phosphotransferase [Planctomycetota bacterium]
MTPQANSNSLPSRGGKQQASGAHTPPSQASAQAGGSPAQGSAAGNAGSGPSALAGGGGAGGSTSGTGAHSFGAGPVASGAGIPGSRGLGAGNSNAGLTGATVVDRMAGRIIKGIGVSSGIVIGRVFVLNDNPLRIAKRLISANAIKAELQRFDAALKASIEEIQAVQKQAEREMGRDAAKIFHFHVGMLTDKWMINPIRKMIETDQVVAEYAASQVLGSFASKFRGNPDPAFATKVNDIDDLSGRLIGHLVGRPEHKIRDLPPNTILLATDLTPSQTAEFDRSRVVGFATDLGGHTSHTAIVAKALGLPAVVGCQNITAGASTGSTAILDSDRGVVVLDPTPNELAEYHGLIEQRRTYQLSLSELADLPAVTLDGTPIELLGNIEFPDEAESVVALGGQGVGLYRTEFLHLTRATDPTEGDHFQAYKRCIELMGGRPLTIRTLDLGADKYTQSRTEVPERNPFLGLRSIRYCLKHQGVFKRQLRAIMRATGLPGVTPGSVKIMFPLITTITELRQAKYILNDVMEDLEEEGQPFDRNIKVGMMVEVPSAAVMAESFASESDFFSIGTNDLVQYTLAVDRINERVQHLYTPAHPAVIRLIRDVVRAAKNHRIPVSCCGESAGDAEFSIVLLGLGVRTLSVTSTSIPRLKRLIRSINISACQRVAKHVLSFDSEVQVETFLRDRVRKIVPEAYGESLAE